jgi:hypothetical protein
VRLPEAASGGRATHLQAVCGSRHMQLIAEDAPLLCCSTACVGSDGPTVSSRQYFVHIGSLSGLSCCLLGGARY